MTMLVLGVVTARRPKADAAISYLIDRRRLLSGSTPRNDDGMGITDFGE